MAIPLRSPLPLRPDPLVAALYAAEVGAPLDPPDVPAHLVTELFAAIPRLRETVPYATVQLLGRLANDPRPEVRAGVARAATQLIPVYLEEVTRLLLALASDCARRVRFAAAEGLATIGPR
jgi:hypothetical protein